MMYNLKEQRIFVGFFENEKKKKNGELRFIDSSRVGKSYYKLIM